MKPIIHFTIISFPYLKQVRIETHRSLYKSRSSPITIYFIPVFYHQENHLDVASIPTVVEARKSMYPSLLINFKTFQKDIEVEESLHKDS